MLARLTPSKMPLGKFHADLEAVCGTFDVIAADNQKDVLGHVSREIRSGIEIAHIAKNVQTVRRTAKDIKNSASENFFLILQEEGSAFMQQNSTTRMMKPGDLILIDSAQPSEFTFFGGFSRQLSLHLPRTEMTARFGGAAQGGQYVQRTDYHAIAISAILSKALEANTTDTQTGFLQEALYGVLGAMLHERTTDTASNNIDSNATRTQILERAMAYVDRCYANSAISAQGIAETLGVSLRQLQRAFAITGTTPTEYLLKKRIEKACQLLKERELQHDQVLVSSIAYDCGFNDVSYFNRQFRRLFGCAPGQFATAQNIQF